MQQQAHIVSRGHTRYHEKQQYLNIFLGTKHIMSPFLINIRPLTEISFVHDSPDSTLLVSAAHDKLPQIRNGESGDWIGTFQGHKGAGVCIGGAGAEIRHDDCLCISLNCSLPPHAPVNEIYVCW